VLGKKREHRNKTLPEKVATTCTEDGHKQTTKSGYNMYRWTQTDNQKWLQHVQMDTNTITKVATTCTDGHRLPKVATTCTENGHRLPKQALKYKPKGRRNIGRPRKRWRDQLHLEDQRTGNTLKPSGT